MERIGLDTPIDALGLDDEERKSLGLPASSSREQDSMDSDMSISLRSSLFDDSSAASSTASKNRGRMFEMERRKHDSVVAGLREQIRSLEHEKRILEHDFDREQRRFHEELLSLQKSSREEIRKVQAKLDSLQAEVPQLRQRLKISHADMEDLRCSHALYEELKQMPEEKRTIREHLLVQVFELEAQSRRSVAELREKSAALEAKVSEASQQCLKKDAEIRLLEHKRADSESLLGAEVAQLRLELEKSRSSLAERAEEASRFRAKSQQFDAIHARCDALERDRAAAMQQASLAATRSSTAEAESSSLREKLSVLSQEKDLLTTDKTHLEREVDGLRRDLSRLKQALEREQEKKREAKRSKEKLRDQLQSVQAETRSAFEQKLDKEVEALKENNREQLDHMKNVHQQLAEREIKNLRCAKEDAVLRAEHLEDKVGELRRECDQLRLDLSTKDAKDQALATELRADIQMKVFQLEQVSGTLDEKNRLLAKLELENEMIRKQMDVLKQEFVQLETVSATTQVKHETQLSLLQDKISAYNAMELELDTAVLQHAAACIADNVESDNRLASIPTAAKRRVEQSVALAQKLIETENLLAQEKRLREEAEHRCRELKAEIKRVKVGLDSVGRPDDYVMSTILGKEKELEKLENERDRLQKELMAEKEKLESSKAAQKQLKADLDTIISERKKLEEAMQRLAEERHVSFKETGRIPPAETPIEKELLLEEVDAPHEDNADPLNSSVHSAASTFVMYKADGDSAGIPLPKWYRRLQQPMK